MNNFDPKVISQMMMQGYVAKARPLEDLIHVTGKVALVTGGTSGLGFCTSLRLLQGGAKVVVASFSEEEAGRAMPLFAQAGFGEDRVKFCKCDVTSEESVKAVVEFTAETFGSLDILVNSAGVWSYAHIYDMPEEEFVRVINVNLNGSFRVAKHVSDYMVKNGIQGKMVFISSDCYTMPFPVFGGYSHYAASKGGIVALTSAMALDLAPFHIQVNSVAPGFTYTGMTKKSFDNEEVRKQSEALIPAGRLGQPEDISNVVMFLLSDLSDYMTGTNVYADGGYHIQK